MAKRLVLFLTVVFLGACDPPFITAHPQGMPFVERSLPFSSERRSEVLEMSRRFASEEAMSIKTSHDKVFSVLLEKGSLRVLADNAGNARQLYVNAWKRDRNDKATDEEINLAERYIEKLSIVLSSSR